MFDSMFRKFKYWWLLRKYNRLLIFYLNQGFAPAEAARITDDAFEILTRVNVKIFWENFRKNVSRSQLDIPWHVQMVVLWGLKI